MADISLFPELEIERARLAHSRACRDAMIEMFERVDPRDSADEFTKEYIEVTVEEALEDLRTPGAGEFFGRIDEDPATAGSSDRWYIGRRHIEDGKHDPVVIDWRAPIAAPFYRATVHDPLGIAHRRRFMMAAGEMTSYLDERLDDPDSADAASGIPDPVLAEIGAARTGSMREIVATIQAEQDVVIRAPIQQALIVQGGPGTGKTAVGLHRAAYLLFEHRRRLMDEGVLVVGPNQVFLDYIGNVLPSLGERSVRQRTVLDLCVPRVDIGAEDREETARLKGDRRLLEVLQRAILAGIKLPKLAIRIPMGTRTFVIEPDEVGSWVDAALGGRASTRALNRRPLNTRRGALKAIAEREILRRSDNDEAWQKAKVLRDAVSSVWPVQQPKAVVQRLFSNDAFLAAVADGLLSADEQELLLAGCAGSGSGKPGSKRRPWTAADQLLLDETNSLLNGPPFTFGHVMVDEAQDHSAVALRVIGRRCPGGSFTILGDLAQSTTPAGQQQWPVIAEYLGADDYEVAHLTIGYRVPEPVLTIANLLLPFTAVDTMASRSVRMDGETPTMRVAAVANLATAVAEEVMTARHRHVLTGVVAPRRLHAEISSALATRGLHAVTRVQDLQRTEIPIFSPEAVKGLEFDAVVVVNPAEIFDGTPRGARLLYVAMTRSVQILRMVGDSAFDAHAL